MKISLLEPLNVSETLIQHLAQPLIDRGHTFEYYDQKTTDAEELYHRSKDSDILIIANNPLPKSVIQRLDNVQLINIAFTGTDHVDQATCDAQGITIMNAAGYAVTAVSELAVGMALSLLRNIPKGDRDIRQGKDFPGKFQGSQLKDKVVGIVGTGEIGIETARLFKAFGCQLIGYNRSEKQEALDLGLVYHRLEEVMALSDIISVHLPLNEETQHLISEDMIALMKPQAILLNLARGPVIDNHALAEALRLQLIGGAGLDVFDVEPPLEDQHELFETPNTILTPHIGYLTNEAMEARAKIVFDNIDKFLSNHA